MRKIRIFLMVSIPILFMSCGLAKTDYYETNFKMNEPYTVSVGTAMIHLESGIYNTMVKQKYGLVEELVFGGVNNDVVQIFYREFELNAGNRTIRDAFNQTLQYDLGKSKIIKYKSMTIEVLGVESSEITYKVIKWDVDPKAAGYRTIEEIEHRK